MVIALICCFGFTAFAQTSSATLRSIRTRSRAPVPSSALASQTFARMISRMHHRNDDNKRRSGIPSPGTNSRQERGFALSATGFKGTSGGGGKISLESYTAFVTGSTDGIGQHTAQRLAKEGCEVIMHGRDSKRLDKAVEQVKKMTGNSKIHGYIADFESLDQVRKLGMEVRDKHGKIDILINNAGVFNPKNRKTKDGYETTWQVNVLAPYLLTSILLPSIKESEGKRVIIVSSISQSSSLDFGNLQQEKGYSAHNAYSISKLADAMMAYELADRLKSKGITVNTLDPGTVNTKMLLDGWGPCGISVGEANDQFWLATSPELTGVTGKYFVYRSESTSNRFAYDRANREKLWKHLEEATGAKFGE